MAKVKPEAANIVPVPEDEPRSMVMSLPEHMRDDANMGLETAAQFIRPPRIKTIQKTATNELLDKFRVGDLVLMPNEFVLSAIEADERGRSAEEGKPFYFTPLFFYAEWMTINPIQMRTSLPMIRARTCDPKDPLVAKCKDQRLWFEPCPEAPADSKFQCRNVEALNFIILVHGVPELEGMPVILSFQRGEHKSGTLFLTLMKMRKAPIFGCVYQGHAQYRPDNGKGDWYGIEINNPSDESGYSPFVVDPAQYQSYKAIHEELNEAHAAGIIVVNYEDDDADAPAGPVDTGEM